MRIKFVTDINLEFNFFCTPCNLSCIFQFKFNYQQFATWPKIQGVFTYLRFISSQYRFFILSS